MNYEEMVKLAYEDILDSLVDEEDFEKEAQARWREMLERDNGQGIVDITKNRVNNSIIPKLAKEVGISTGTSMARDHIDRAKGISSSIKIRNRFDNNDKTKSLFNTIERGSVDGSNIGGALKTKERAHLELIGNAPGKSLADIRNGAIMKLYKNKKLYKG